MKLHPRFKLWFSTPEAEGVFGDGKWRLLKAIDQHGSLKAAAETLGMSYRKAWGDLKKAEKHLGVGLIEKLRGGKTGGGTRLTDAGREWMTAYSCFRSDVEKAVSKGYEKHIANLMRTNSLSHRGRGIG